MGLTQRNARSLIIIGIIELALAMAGGIYTTVTVATVSKDPNVPLGFACFYVSTKE